MHKLPGRSSSTLLIQSMKIAYPSVQPNKKRQYLFSKPFKSMFPLQKRNISFTGYIIILTVRWTFIRWYPRVLMHTSPSAGRLTGEQYITKSCWMPLDLVQIKQVIGDVYLLYLAYELYMNCRTIYTWVVGILPSLALVLVLNCEPPVRGSFVH